MFMVSILLPFSYSITLLNIILSSGFIRQTHLLQQALLESSVKQTLMTALTNTVLKAHVSMVLRRHFVNVQLGRLEPPVRKVVCTFLMPMTWYHIGNNCVKLEEPVRNLIILATMK